MPKAAAVLECPERLRGMRNISRRAVTERGYGRCRSVGCPGDRGINSVFSSSTRTKPGASVNSMRALQGT